MINLPGNLASSQGIFSRGGILRQSGEQSFTWQPFYNMLLTGVLIPFKTNAT